MESSRSVGCRIRKGCVRVGAEYSRESKVCRGEDGAWLSYYHGGGEAMTCSGGGRKGEKREVEEVSSSLLIVLPLSQLFPIRGELPPFHDACLYVYLFLP